LGSRSDVLAAGQRSLLFMLPISLPLYPLCLPPTHTTSPSAAAVQSNKLMALIWGGALVGMAQCLFFSRAPKALAATLYVALGWASLPFMSQFQAVLPPVDLALIVVGGIVYSLGVSDARQRCCWVHCAVGECIAGERHGWMY
jgi:hemolysin III